MTDRKRETLKFLVVEDDEASRTIIARFLNHLGYSNLVLAKNGKAAINQLKLSPVDLIISDWRMPDMDGLELYWAAKNQELLDDAPFLMVSAENERGKVLEALQAGVSDYIVKPVNSEILKSKIDKLLKL
ncbi:MAG: response regulator [Nitrospinaceae bacterium]|nr:response regulator [Nitrospinaceae bacterium]MBT5869525.1 response regulator [Nitrospinaceae bacterium]